MIETPWELRDVDPQDTAQPVDHDHSFYSIIGIASLIIVGVTILMVLP